MHITSERQGNRGHTKLGINTLLMFAVVMIALLSGCSTNLPNRQGIEVLGVTQKQSKTKQLPDEYYFCDLEKGAWKCPEQTRKSKLTQIEPTAQASRASVQHPVVSSASEVQSPTTKQTGGPLSQYTPEDQLRKNFSSVDLLGKPLGKVHFSFDSYEVYPYSQDVIAFIAPAIKGKSIILLGFTDNIGTELYNDSLARKRAEAVKSEFIKRGIPSTNIHTEGNGICCYLVPNGTDEQRKINRRVEIYAVD